MSQVQDAKKMSTFTKFVIIGGVVLVGLAIANGIKDASDTGPAGPSAEQLLIEAEQACEGAVDQNLKAPADAKYDSVATGSGPWTVTGFVDAQNSFGAVVRSDYTCTTELQGKVMLATLETLTGR